RACDTPSRRNFEVGWQKLAFFIRVQRLHELADARAAGEQTTDHRVLDTKRREFIALVRGGGLLLAANVRRYILSLDIISAKVQIDSNRTSRKSVRVFNLYLIGTPLSVPRGSSRLRPGERPCVGGYRWSMRTNIARWLCSTIAGP